MPTAAAAQEIYQVRFEGRNEGQQVINVLHFSTPSGDSDVETHLLAVVIQCFITNILPVLLATYTLERVISKRVSPTVGPDIITVPSGSLAGGDSRPGLPNYAAGVVSIRTVRGGRSGRGRIFFGAIPEDATIASAFDPAEQYWQALIAFCACIVSAFHSTDVVGTNQWVFGVVSRKLGNAKPPFTAAQFAAIGTSTTPGALTPVAQLATQRSRKVGHGS